MARENNVKRATFYQAVILRDGRKEHPASRDWNAELKKIADKTSLKERRINDRLYDPVKINGQYLLGIHKPINTDYMTTINEDASSITDFLVDKKDQSLNFAHSTAVLFTGHRHIFAMSLGHQHAPRQNSVRDFLTKYFPPGDKAYWEIEPLLDKSQLDLLKSARGAISFSTYFSTRKDLFSDQDPKGVASAYEELAAELGSELEVKIEVRLAKDGRGKAATTKFLNFLKRDLRTTTGPDSRAQARAILQDGAEDELQLVAHKLAEEFELGNVETERKQFSSLLSGLQNVSGAMDTRVKQILER